MSWDVASKLNPEFVKIARMSLPRRRAVFIAGLVAALVAGGGWLLWQQSAPNVYHNGNLYLSDADLWAMQTRDFGRAAFEGLSVLLFCLLFIVAPAVAGVSFVYERLRGTAVFQQMTLLSPFRQAAGKFLGSGLFAYFVAAMLIPPALFAAYLGETNPYKVLRIYLFLLVGGLCWQAIGLFVSASLAGSPEKTLRGGLLVGPLVGVGGAATALALGHYFTVDIEALRDTQAFSISGDYYNQYNYDYYLEQGRYWWRFYGAAVPAYLVVLGVLAFVGAWAFAGAVRRVKAWQLIPTGPRAVWLFFASAEAVVVGLLWGRHVSDATPSERLIIYLLLNSCALVALAGAAAVGRGRLSEWWSVARDPVALFQREEIKNAVKTYLVVLGIAEAGLAALWLSYHLHPLTGDLQSLTFPVNLAAAGASLGAFALGAAAFIQFCAMFRFRVGGVAGVALLTVFYVFVTLAGALFDKRNNTFTLINPLLYTETLTRGDTYLDSYLEVREPRIELRGRGCEVREEMVFAPPKPAMRTLGYCNPLIKDCVPRGGTVVYEARRARHRDMAQSHARGLVAQTLLALFCFGLAGLKWSRTRGEMLGGRAAAQVD